MEEPKDRDQLHRERAAHRQAKSDTEKKLLMRAHAERLRRRSAREDWLALMGLLLAVLVTGAFIGKVLLG